MSSMRFVKAHDTTDAYNGKQELSSTKVMSSLFKCFHSHWIHTL